MQPAEKASTRGKESFCPQERDRIAHMRSFRLIVNRLMVLLAVWFSIPLVAAPSVSREIDPAPHAQLRAVKVTILSTMLADEGVGEWGFSALVEAGDRRILVDTGARPQTVLQNARELGIDLASVQE